MGSAVNSATLLNNDINCGLRQTCVRPDCRSKLTIIIELTNTSKNVDTLSGLQGGTTLTIRILNVKLHSMRNERYKHTDSLHSQELVIQTNTGRIVLFHNFILEKLDYFIYPLLHLYKCYFLFCLGSGTSFSISKISCNATICTLRIMYSWLSMWLM